MKKTLSILVALVLLLGLATTVMAADVAPEFTDQFYPDGKIGKITEVYYQISKDDQGRATAVYMWLTQPDDVMAMFKEMTEMDDNDAWFAKYHCNITSCFIQIDCKVDDGDWQYVSDWDIGEYTQENQPYFMTLTSGFEASTTEKTYGQGSAILDAFYGQDDETAGFLKSVIKNDDDTWYFDLENHSLTLRARYLLRYENEEMTEEEWAANGEQYHAFLLSDWSDEITIGKNGTQTELEKPEKLEAPVISQLSFVSSTADEDLIRGEWKVLVDFPKQLGDAEKYYVIMEGGFEPLCAYIEYRVQKDGTWGEWQESYWGNATSITSGWKTFSTEGVTENDTIEFRVYVQNRMEEDKDSEYSNSLFCNAGESQVVTEEEEPSATPTITTAPTPTTAPVVEKTEKQKCKVCGICPFQPLGICLFIWLVIIIVVVIIVYVVLKKNNKDKEKKNKMHGEGRMNLLVLIGSGAVGKMTVGQELMKITDYRLFHNHHMIEPVIEIFGKFDGAVVSKLREDIFDAFIKTDYEGLIFTYMWAFDMPSDWNYIRSVADRFEASGGTVYYVELVADREVRIERNKTENRLKNKASKRNIVVSEDRMLREETKYRLVSNDGELPFEHYLKIDNTNLEPAEVAHMIKEHFHLPDGGVTELMNRVKLEEVREDELSQLYDMQIQSFMPLYEKYHDEGSPAIEPMEKVRSRAAQENRKYYFIVKDGARVGAVNLGHKSSDIEKTCMHICPLFILPRYQNQGIGYVAIQKAFALYPNAKVWKLDTILQEPGNCHLYEKCGFVRVGEEHVVNDKMTLVEYEKR